MLILTRSAGEQVVIGGEIRVVVLRVAGNSVRLGIGAPDDIRVDRLEVHEKRVRGELRPAPVLRVAAVASAVG